MSKVTERLVQIAAVMVIIWFGWNLAKESIIGQINANNNAAVAMQRLQACEAKK